MFTLRIDRSMDGLEQVGDWVDGVAAALGLDATADYAMRLCIEEAAANVVMHGVAGPADDADSVVLRVEPLAGALRVVVEDRCAAFDPLGVPPPAPPSSLGEARIGGLGIHLMRQYAQSMEYERAGNVNRLTMVVAR
jgi:anti-sigma regulatory factor (Ser/Thr protein kinase)